MISPIIRSGLESAGRKSFARFAIIHRTVFVATALSLFAGCTTSEPLISRKGVSSMALGEIGWEMLSIGGTPVVPPSLETEEVNYFAGVIPMKGSKKDEVIDNGTRFFVDGHKRGMVPWVGTLPKPGPHQVRLEFPAFKPYTLRLEKPILLHTTQGDLEAWPPVIVHVLTGEIFTTQETSAVDLDRNSGTRKKTDIAKKVGKNPLLIVTTTTKIHPSWRKLGQMRVEGQVTGSGNKDHARLPSMSLDPSYTNSEADDRR